MITPQEIQWLHRVEEILELPENKLVQALIRDRTNAALDKIFPLKQHKKRRQKANENGQTANPAAKNPHFVKRSQRPELVGA